VIQFMGCLLCPGFSPEITAQERPVMRGQYAIFRLGSTKRRLKVGGRVDESANFGANTEAQKGQGLTQVANARLRITLYTSLL